MSFEAKRLRVQLPCPEGESVKEIDIGGRGCLFPTDPCEGGTCWFQSPPVCRFPTYIGCEYFGTPPMTCVYFGSPPPTCHYFGTPPCPYDTCGWRSPVACGPGTDLVIDPGRILVDPEQLPALREALEAQLKEIDKAEEELRKHREANE